MSDSDGQRLTKKWQKEFDEALKTANEGEE
jgi:hypothetical protein